MDKLDFAAHLAAYKRDSNRQAIPALIVLCAALFGMLLLAPYLGTSVWLMLLFFAAAIGITIGWSLIAERMAKRTRQKHHMACPFCNQAWTGEVGCQIVMATGHCRHCGSRVLTEE